jgi:hypothetical protein
MDFPGKRRIVSNFIFHPPSFGPIGLRIIREMAAFLGQPVMEMHARFDFLIKQTLPGVAQTLIAHLLGRNVVALEVQEQEYPLVVSTSEFSIEELIFLLAAAEHAPRKKPFPRSFRSG